MKKHLKYLEKNQFIDARLVVPPLAQIAIIYPANIVIKKDVAFKIINKLNLSCASAHKDHRNHETGSTMYIFNSNLYKY